MSPEHVDPATRRTYKYRLYPTPTQLDAGGALRLEPVTAAVARLRSALSPNQPEGQSA